MKARRVTNVFLASLLAAASLHAAKPSAGGSSGTSSLAAKVTSSVVDLGLAAPVILSDAANSGSDSYVTSKTAGTTSQFMSDGEWNVASGTKRAFWLDLGADSLFPGSFVSATIFTYCTNYGLRPVASLKGVGDATTCPMLFRIGGPTDPVFYRLAFNSYNRPGTENAVFTCEAVKSATDPTCTRWSVRPDDTDASGRGRGRLVHVQSSTRSTPEVETDVADYDVAYEFAITRP